MHRLKITGGAKGCKRALQDFKGYWKRHIRLRAQQEWGYKGLLVQEAAKPDILLIGLQLTKAGRKQKQQKQVLSSKTPDCAL